MSGVEPNSLCRFRAKVVHSARCEAPGDQRRHGRGCRTSSFHRASVLLRRRKPPADIDLLLRRMAVLNIEPVEVDSADPLLFRELQGLCTLCQSKGPCACDLARDDADTGSRDWREYCPNAATIGLLSRTDQARASRNGIPGSPRYNF